MKGILHKSIGCAILLLCVVAIVRAGESRSFHGQYVEKIGFISIENDELNLIFYGLYFDFIVVIFY